MARRRRKKNRVIMMPISAAEVGSLYPGKLDFPCVAEAGMEDTKTPRLIGIGGLAWIHGRCWLFADFIDMKRTHPMVMVRTAKRMLRKAYQLGEREVWARREVGLEPLSHKLLKLVGFVYESGDDELEDWVYRWPHSPQSHSD